METKFATIDDVKAVDKKERLIEFTATKEILDYDNEIVKVEGMDISKIKKTKSFLWSHQKESPPIGKITKIWKDGKTIKGQAQMTSEEEYSFGFTIYKLIQGGYINNVSVSFIPDRDTMEFKDNKNGRTTAIINNSTMIEISAVNIGANTAAMVEAKSFKDGIDKALNDGVINDTELNECTEMVKELKPEVKEVDTTTDTIIVDKTKELAKKLIEQETKIAELELQLKEQQMEEEINEEDNYLTELFEEFNPAGSTETVADPEHMETNPIDEALNIINNEENINED